MAERPYTNRGEYLTYQCLKQLSLTHPEDKLTIFANLFFNPVGQATVRQVDHLITSHRGVFILETKYWAGTIYHQVCNQQLQVECEKFWPLIKDGLPPEIRVLSGTTPYTLVAQPNRPLAAYYGFGNPAEQVRTAKTQLQGVLGRYLKVPPFVHGFVVYAYPRGAANTIVDLNQRLDADDQNTAEPEGFTSVDAFAAFYDHLPEGVMQYQRLTAINTCIKNQIIS